MKFFVQFFTLILLCIFGSCASEPVGQFLWPDDHGEFFLDLLKKPSIEMGCSENTKFIIGIIARPSEFDHREFIRKKWGLPAYRDCDKTKIVFILGKSEHPRVDYEVIKEAEKYQDILLFDYKESYNLVLRKVFGYFRWVKENCPNVKCAMKGDSDTVINVSGMEFLCDSLPDNDYYATGMAVHYQPDRNPNGKHYTPYFVWPDGYPTFVTGFSYMFSGYGVVPRLMKTLQEETAFYTSENFRRMWEDVVIAGILREKAGIKPNHNHGFGWNGWISYWNTKNSNHPEMSIILSVETWKREEAWKIIYENRLQYFPKYSSRECYQKSF